MMITSNAATMIVAGAETGQTAMRDVFVHNDGPGEIYIEVTANIFTGPGSPHCVVPPYGALALDGSRTYWARTRDGTVATIHILPTGTFGNLPAALPGG
jgi:hypothetical protein